jgi:hypothetical protein
MSGLVVIDVDPRNGGYASLQAWEAENGPLADTLVTSTGGGGRHFFYSGTGIPSRKPWLKGVDVKAGGNGYVILPPGRHVKGGTYRMANRLTVARLPPRLAESIVQGSVGSSGQVGDFDMAEVLSGIPEGKARRLPLQGRVHSAQPTGARSSSSRSADLGLRRPVRTTVPAS